MSKKSLVIGINGMDGRTITKILLDNGNTVVGTFRRNTLDLKEIHEFYNHSDKLTFEYCDINDFESVESLLSKHNDANEVYLLAAQSHVGYSFHCPSESVRTNGMSVFNFLENIKNINKTIRLYFAATSELFGGKHSEPQNEQSEFFCRSPYAIGKELGTRWIKYYRDLGLFCCYGILFNHSNCFRGKDFFIRRVTNSAAKIAIGKQKQLQLGNLEFYRDEHWSDLGCEMMIRMLNNSKPKDYVIGNDICHHGEKYLYFAFNYFNLDWKKYVIIDKSRFRPNEVHKLVSDSRKAQKEIGWRPNRISFQNHIGMMCEFDYRLESGKNPSHPNVFDLYP